MTETTTINQTYRDWTIQTDPDRVGELICFPTAQGIDHDYDYEGERYRYCGNCLWFNDLAEAEAGIDDHIIEQQERRIEVLRNALMHSTACITAAASTLELLNVQVPVLREQAKKNEHAINFCK